MVPDVVLLLGVLGVIASAVALHLFWVAPNHDNDWLLITARRFVAGEAPMTPEEKSLSEARQALVEQQAVFSEESPTIKALRVRVATLETQIRSAGTVWCCRSFTLARCLVGAEACSSPRCWGRQSAGAVASLR